MTSEPLAMPDEPYVDPGQLCIPGLGPNAGERYRHRTTGTVIAVLAVERRRYSWVTIRVHGEPQTIRTSNFMRVFERI